MPAPRGVSFEQGAAFPVNYATGYAALVIMGGLKEGERVLIHAAAGGVGTAATQIAKDLGAEIYGTASASKHDAIRAQGVDHAIDYRNHGLRAGRQADHRRRRLDVMIDAIGPSSSERATAASSRGAADHVRAIGDADGGDTGPRRHATGLAKMPLATMPWWQSLAVMNENKGVFGLNMLTWWDAEGGLDRILDPLLTASRTASSIRSSPRPSRSTAPRTRTA